MPSSHGQSGIHPSPSTDRPFSPPPIPFKFRLIRSTGQSHQARDL